MQICKVVFVIFTNFDIAAGRKAGTKKTEPRSRNSVYKICHRFFTLSVRSDLGTFYEAKLQHFF